MKKIIKFALILISLVFAQQASSTECSSNPNNLEKESLKYYHSNIGKWCTAPPQQVFTPQVVTTTPSQAVATISGGNCAAWSERVGRVIGANQGNDARNTENGGILGALFGSFVCNNNGNGAVPAVKKAGHCIIGGVSYPELVDNEPECLAKWKEIAKTSSQIQIAETAASAKLTTTHAGSTNTTGVWGWFDPSATASNPKPCFVTKQVSSTMAKCSSVSVLPPTAGETQGAWEARMASLK